VEPRAGMSDLRRGIALALLAVLLFTVMVALVKWLSRSFSPMQVGFFRASCALALCLPVLLADSGVRGLRTAAPGAYVLRGLLGAGAIVTSFYAIAMMPLADWTAVTFLVPLFVAALSAPLLGETVGWRRWVAILAGFAGVLVIVPPTGTASLWALAISVSSQMMVALALVLIRRMGARERTTTIVFYYMLALTLITSAIAPAFWIAPQGVEWALLALVGLIGGAAHLLVTTAYRIAPASVIAPFDYTGMLWALLIGWWVWNEAPDANLLIGAPLVIVSGFYVVMSAARRAPPGVSASR
jgi:drug/metabolite transporter (DMT)-like permease